LLSSEWLSNHEYVVQSILRTCPFGIRSWSHN
jgi:hypothetical protein